MEDIRCDCGKLICQVEGDAVVIKCRHCKRLIRIHLDERGRAGPSLPAAEDRQLVVSGMRASRL